jgi:hypothetical protein
MPRLAKRPSLVSPDVIRSDMGRVRRVAYATGRLADVIAKSYEELYEAALMPGSGPEGIPPGRHGFRVSDPTGDVATSGKHKRMRWHADRAAEQLRRVEESLGWAEWEIVQAFAETDPEMREKLRRLRELEAESGRK